ncbi:MAG: hypothetical protein HYU66_21235 [Armatimonadetes bacterium]|nr:hypothetical protein [Armatimonadota bacterium]
MVLPLALALVLPTALDPPRDGLMLWLDAGDTGSLTATNGRVTAWRSLAPGVAVQLTAEPGRGPALVGPEQRPGPPALAFDGQAARLRALEFGHTAAVWTLFVLVAPDRRPRGGGLVSATSAGGREDYDPGFTLDLFSAAAAFDSLSVEGAGRLAGQLNLRTRSDPFGGLHLLTVERGAERVRVRVDGQDEGARPMAPAVTQIVELRLGCRSYGGAEKHFCHGEIAAVLLYDRLLTPAERDVVEAELAVDLTTRAAAEAACAARYADWLAHRMEGPKPMQTWPSVAAFPGGRDLEALPVRRDLIEALRLGVHCLCSMFDADRDGEPFFYSNHRADGTGEFHHSVNIGIPHVVGRCLLGGQMAEECAGVDFPPDAVATLARYLRGSFDNEDHLNSYYEADGRRLIEFHNVREGLWGLWAMIRRGDPWARDMLPRTLDTLAKLTDAQGRWSVKRAQALGMAERCSGFSSANACRAVEPLLALWRETGDQTALRLAGLYARDGLRELFEPDGRFAPMARSSGHVHSITSSLAGITEYAVATGDADLLAACRRIVAVGVPGYFSSWGWGDEVFPDHPADEPGRGEINQTGDVIRTGLTLGAAGDPHGYALAERYTRSMLLPTQHREAELRRFLHDVPEPRGDYERSVLLRTVGGSSMQLPNDRMRAGDWPLATLDITSGAVHALAECRRHGVTHDGDNGRVNLLFDHDDDRLTVRSGLPFEGRLSLTARAELHVLVRVPEGTDPATARAGDKPVAVRGGYLDLGRLAAGETVELTFDLPCRAERETVDGVAYTTTWVGSQIIRIEPRGEVSPLPF